MREIKFRVWNKENKKMWSHELLQRNSIFALDKDLPSEEFLVIPTKKNYILLQYTGMKAKNGVDIYEGDIVSYKGGKKQRNKERGIVFGEVIFKNGMFTIKDNKSMFLDSHVLQLAIEVIGNIYENPECMNYIDIDIDIDK